MSAGKEKDAVLTLSEAEFWTPLVDKSLVRFLDEYPQPSSFLRDGSINVECPCLQSALAHRCGYLMRKAIACFNASKVRPKGGDCEREFTEQMRCADERS